MNGVSSRPLVIFSGILLTAFMLLPGCRCCPSSNCYYNVVDDISDKQLTLDRFYRPTLDISRAGMPDWCQSRLNCKLCGCRCNGTCCRTGQPLYPAEYRLRYEAHLAQEAAKKQSTRTPSASPVPPLPK